MTSGNKVAISVIVPVHNSAVVVPEQLAALDQQEITEPWELLLVDDRSTDGSLEILERFAADRPHVRVLHTTDGTGSAHARNLGVRAARSSRLAFCDADDVVDGRWVAELLRALDEHALVGGRLDYETLNPPWLRESRFTRQSAGLSEIFGAPSVMGCNLACRRDVWEVLGGLDEGFGSGGQDAEFCLRAHRSLGVSAHYVSDALVHYRLRPDARSAFRQSVGYGRSWVLLYTRYGRGQQIAPARIAIAGYVDLLRALLFSVTGRAGRMRCATRLGTRLGRLQESFRQRVFML